MEKLVQRIIHSHGSVFATHARKSAAIMLAQVIFWPTNHAKRNEVSEVNIGWFLFFGDEALVFHFWIVAEVHEQTQFALGCAKIVQKLRTVLIHQGGGRL